MYFQESSSTTKGGFISQEWWPDFCNYRRRNTPVQMKEFDQKEPISEIPPLDSYSQQQSTGSLITRELRAACGFTGKGMDGRLSHPTGNGDLHRDRGFHLPRDKHNHEYGWGWSLLNLPKISMAGRLANATELPGILSEDFRASERNPA